MELQEAAEHILTADFILIAAGAGFSADTGLPVYNDVARNKFYADKDINYSDLADTNLIIDNIELFWKFWGDCIDDYRSHIPHDGYSILNSWVSNLPHMNTRNLTSPNPWYVYTSNVDGHFRKFELLNEFLCEMHGCLEESICSSSIGHWVQRTESGEHIITPRLGDKFNNWINGRSEISLAQCRECVYRTPSPPYPSTPVCPICSYPLRPCVLMFGDSCPAVLPRIWSKTDTYQEWEDSVEKFLAAGGGKLVVLELGCGLRVPSVRNEVEQVVTDVCALQSKSGATVSGVLIRINKDEANIDEHIRACSPHSIGIQARCKDALVEINKIITERMKT